MKVETIRVTPDKAKKWLAKNHPHNRAVSWSRVQAFTNDIAAGNWKLTHQAIAFDGEGMLIDGQHRLHAVVNSGVAVEMLVITNEDAHFHDPIDRGAPRTVAMLAGMRNNEAAACRVLCCFETGQVQATGKGVPMTVSEAVMMMEHHRKYSELVGTAKGQGSLVGGLRAAAIWVMPIDQAGTLEFLHKVQTGELIQRGDPAYAFRHWRERTSGLSAMEMALAACNCLRYHLNGHKLMNVYMGEVGYRAACGKRRALRIPHTPGNDQVIGVSWPVARGEPT